MIKLVLLIVTSLLVCNITNSGGSGDMNPSLDEFNGQAMITFSYDDGYRNNYTVAMPLHEEYGVPATFNICTDWVIKDHRYAPVMTVEDLLDLQSRGFEIASHTVTHGIDEDRYPDEYPDGKRLEDMTDTQVERELYQSKRQLAEWGITVNGLALPYGSHAVNRDLYSYYYEYVRSSKLGSLNYDILNKYDLPVAFVADKDNSVSDLKTVIDDAIAQQKWIIVMMHHVIESEDAVVPANSVYYWYESQLEEILQYVAAKQKTELLPISTRDALYFLREPVIVQSKRPKIKDRNIACIMVKRDGVLRRCQSLLTKQ